MGGEIHLDSERTAEGKGACFVFTVRAKVQPESSLRDCDSDGEEGVERDAFEDGFGVGSIFSAEYVFARCSLCNRRRARSHVFPAPVCLVSTRTPNHVHTLGSGRPVVFSHLRKAKSLRISLARAYAPLGQTRATA